MKFIPPASVKNARKRSLVRACYKQERQLAYADVNAAAHAYRETGLKPLCLRCRWWHLSRLRCWLRALLRLTLFWN